jgi:hypothetical protein
LKTPKPQNPKTPMIEVNEVELIFINSNFLIKTTNRKKTNNIADNRNKHKIIMSKPMLHPVSTYKTQRIILKPQI